MASYNQVAYGSQGDDVKTLQKLLNQNGYNLSEDGIFGSKTQSAVRDYQQKNKLAVDGIVGTNTWGTLTKTLASSTPTSSVSATRNYNAYTESDAVKQAQALLQQQLSQKPGAYQSAWQTQLNDNINKILNREKFSYDLNGDALYQQYKDQYMLQGQQAMMDTMGQAQAMTGGYGNSYAQTAGQQAYQGHLHPLNDRIPELYQLALNQYNQEGENLLNQYGLLTDQENQDYGRYRDQMSDWQSETNRLQDRYDTERDYDYGMWADGRDFQYQQERDKIADAQWQKEFDEAKRQYDQQYALQSGASSSKGSSSGSSSKSSTSSSSKTSNTSTYNNGKLTSSQIKDLQRALGVTADGKWGAASQAAAKKKWGSSNVSADKAWTYYTTKVRVPTASNNAATEQKMANYVKNMLDNATSSRFNPEQAINANSSLTAAEKKTAQAILKQYINSGYMK